MNLSFLLQYCLGDFISYLFKKLVTVVKYIFLLTSFSHSASLFSQLQLLKVYDTNIYQTHHFSALFMVKASPVSHFISLRKIKLTPSFRYRGTKMLNEFDYSTNSIVFSGKRLNEKRQFPTMQYKSHHLK